MSPSSRESRFHISVDTWAVLLAILLAVLVRLGILKTVTW
jgi:hypothetical protein